MIALMILLVPGVYGASINYTAAGTSWWGNCVWNSPPYHFLNGSMTSDNDLTNGQQIIYASGNAIAQENACLMRMNLEQSNLMDLFHTKSSIKGIGKTRLTKPKKIVPICGELNLSSPQLTRGQGKSYQATLP